MKNLVKKSSKKTDLELLCEKFVGHELSTSELDIFCVKSLRNKKFPKRLKQEAYAIIYKNHCKHLEFYIFKKVNDIEVAKDLASVILAKSFEKIDQFKYGAFSTWLYAIAKHTIIDYVRSKKSNRDYLLFEDLAAESNDGDTTDFQIKDDDDIVPDSVLVTKEQTHFLTKIIDSFENAKMKEIISLLVYEGMQYDEIAEKCDVPLGTVKSLIYRGKKIIESQTHLFV